MIVLGVIGVIIALFAPNPYARGLFGLVAAVPVIVGLITYARLSKAGAKDGDVSKVIIEASWITMTFGLAYLVMSPSTFYYPGNAGILAALIVLGIVQAVFGGYSLASYGKKGYMLTP